MFITFLLTSFHTQPPLSHSLFRKNFTKNSNTYKRLGQFSYDQHHYTSDNIQTCIKEINDNNYEWIYIGEVREGTDHIPHGIGIKVWSKDGSIEEGYWQNGGRQGRGRDINCGGVCYIGEYKEGKRNGEGTRYWSDGDKWYEGGWKDGEYYGQGTCYKNKNKYTGQWDDNYKGQGEINYEDGTKYIGQWDCSYRHGLGTLYSADGQVLNQGKWEKDEYKGKE